VRRTRIPLSSTWATGTTWLGLLIRAIHVRFWHIVAFVALQKVWSLVGAQRTTRSASLTCPTQLLTHG